MKATLANTEAVGHLLLAHLKAPEEVQTEAAPPPDGPRDSKAPSKRSPKDKEKEDDAKEAES